MKTSFVKKAIVVGSSAAMALSSFAFAGTAFAAAHAAGTNVVSNGTVYFIDNNGQLRPYTSAGAFLSYGFNSWSNVVAASAEDMALPRGSFVPPMDGSLINDHGTVYLMTNGQRAGFTSAANFLGLGYAWANVIPGDTSFLTSAPLINTTAMAHPAGTLVNDHGTVYLLTTTGKMGIPSLSVFNSWGYSFSKVAPANSYDSALPMSAGVMNALVPGQLNPTGSNGGVVIPPTSGSVSVSLASDNPGANTLVAGQATADLAHFTFYGTGAVTSVQLKRIGVSADSTLANVYLYQGNTRLTDAASVTSGSNISFANPNGLFNVNGSTTISVRADVAANTSGQTVGVQLVSAMSGSSAVAGTPISGNVSTISGVTTAGVSIAANTVTGTPSINAGSMGQTVWSAPVTVTTRAVWLKSLALREIGSAPTTALSNYSLYVDGSKVGSAAGLTLINGQNYAFFDLGSSPVNLNIGSHTVEVRADFVNGATRTVQFSLQNAADIMLTDSQLNSNLTVSGTVPNSAASITIGNGSITITSDPTFGTTTTVTGGATNTPIGRFQFKAYGEDMQVNSLTVVPTLNAATGAGTIAVTNGLTTVTGTGTSFTVGSGMLVINGVPYAATFTSGTAATLGTAYAGTTNASSAYQTVSGSMNNVSLYVNGSQVGSTQNFTGSALLTFNLGSSLIIPAGSTSTVEVRADLINNSNASITSGTVGVILPAGSSNAQGRYSGTLYSTPAASSAVTLTVGTATLTVAANNSLVSQNVSPNTQNVKIGSFVLQASNAEPIRVTNLAVAVGGTASLNNLSNLKVFVNGTQVGSTVGAPTASQSFSPNTTIAPSSTSTVDVYGDLGTATSGTYQTTLTATSIGTNSNQTSTSAATAGQTMTVAVGSLATPTLVASASTTSQYVAAGTNSPSTATTTASYNFSASNGTAVINELHFTAGTGATSVTVNGVTAPFVSGTATVTFQNGISVPNGSGGVNVPVTVNYSPVGATGVASGQTNTLTLTYVKYTAAGTTTTITPSVAANQMTLVASAPTVVNASGMTGFSLGAQNQIGQATITASSAGNIAVNQIVFNVATAGITTPTVTSPTLTIGGTAVAGSSCSYSAPNVTCTFTSPGYVIAAGASQTFTLNATVGGTQSGSSTMSVSSTLTPAGFLWTDQAGNGSVGGQSGTLINNFPTGSYTIK